MNKNLPYVPNPGTLRTMLERIKESILPERFNGEFVETKLKMKGGSAKSIVPFLKKMNFVTLDGIPTEIYKEYRNKSRSGYAIAKGMRHVYSEIFEQNEYAYDMTDTELMGLIVQLTGGDEKSSTLKFTLQTFKILKDMAIFEMEEESELEVMQDKDKQIHSPHSFAQPLLHYPQNQSLGVTKEESIHLAYTINLNLPATTNIEVFNAIFKSLKENLLDQ